MSGAAEGVLGILQARMASSRLPGKMMLPVLHGRGALELMLRRVARARSLDRVVVATTEGEIDDPIAHLCSQLGHDCFPHRGYIIVLCQLADQAPAQGLGGVVGLAQCFGCLLQAVSCHLVAQQSPVVIKRLP